MSKSGTVYKLCCVDTDIEECYVGSTKNFNRRRTSHKSVCNNEKNNYYNLYVYQFIRDNGGFNNWSMIQLEVVNYETKRDLEAHERRWIEQLKPKLNKYIPVRTRQEYKEYQKEYQKDKKDNIKEYQKQYQKDNKDKIKQYQKQYNKEYQKNNRDKIKQYHKEYNKNNKDNKDNAV